MVAYDPSVDAVYTFLVYTALALVGACMGSFSSAITYRVVQGESWISQKDPVTGKSAAARSRCPACGHILSVCDLVPVLSWILSGGACRYCQVKIPLRYPLVEMTGAVVLCLYFAVSKGGGEEGALVVFMAALPFFLSFCGVILQKTKPPFYLWGGGLTVVLLFVLSLLSA